MSRIRVLIVDDSPFIRKALVRIFESEPAIEVAGVARDGKEALDKVMALSPDVVTLDIMMPGMDGIETLKIIMETKPTPVLMLSQFTREGAELTLNALELGAMDVVDKSSAGLMDFSRLTFEITTKIKAIAGSKPQKITEQSKTLQGITGKNIIDVVAIGTSTGGPPALQVILPKFPADIRFGLLIVQHMPQGFTGPLARRLDTICNIHIKEAEEGDRIQPGLALIAPSGLHMKVQKMRGPESGASGWIKLDIEPSGAIHKPSADVLFESVAEKYGSRAIGVILTGMGSDGAKGMQRIKERGGLTIAQDEATSTIFGMPKAAIERGVVSRVAPVTSIAKEIMENA